VSKSYARSFLAYGGGAALLLLLIALLLWHNHRLSTGLPGLSALRESVRLALPMDSRSFARSVLRDDVLGAWQKSGERKRAMTIFRHWVENSHSSPLVLVEWMGPDIYRAALVLRSGAGLLARAPSWEEPSITTAPWTATASDLARLKELAADGALDGTVISGATDAGGYFVTVWGSGRRRTACGYARLGDPRLKPYFASRGDRGAENLIELVEIVVRGSR